MREAPEAVYVDQRAIATAKRLASLVLRVPYEWSTWVASAVDDELTCGGALERTLPA